MTIRTFPAAALALLLAACQPGGDPPPAPPAPSSGEVIPAPGVDVTAPTTGDTRIRSAATAGGTSTVGAPGSLDGSPESCAAAHGVVLSAGIPSGAPSNLAAYQACVAARTR